VKLYIFGLGQMGNILPQTRAWLGNYPARQDCVL